MQNSDTAIAVDGPNGDRYTTEVGDLLFSLQALLIRETQGGGAVPSFAVAGPAEQPRWSLEEGLSPAAEIAVVTPATSDTPVSEITPHAPSQVTALPEYWPEEVSRPSPSYRAVEPEPVLFDPSTGAPNLNQMSKEIDRYGSRVSASLVALDVTPISDIRAQAGDATAEAILRAIVEAVPFALRAEDQVFRTGMDELTLCVPGAGLSDAAVMGLRLQMAVKDVLARRELPPVILSIRPYQQVAA